jgi:hypothetical protein
VGKKRKRRVPLKTVSPEALAARASGELPSFPRGTALARVLDTAIWLWFLDKDPLSVHLLIMAAHNCLEGLGKKPGKGPRRKDRAGADKFEAAFDFLRHASSNPQVGFPPPVNGPILFDAIASFERVFGNVTIYMRTFRAYLITHPEGVDSDARQRLLARSHLFLPKDITIEEASRLGRIEFFAKLREMFAAASGL